MTTKTAWQQSQTRPTQDTYAMQARVRPAAQQLSLIGATGLARRILTDAGFPYGEEVEAVPHPSGYGKSSVAWDMELASAGIIKPLVALAADMQDELTTIHECAHIIRNGPSYAGVQGDDVIAHDDQWFTTFARLMSWYATPKCWRQFQFVFGIVPSVTTSKTAGALDDPIEYLVRVEFGRRRDIPPPPEDGPNPVPHLDIHAGERYVWVLAKNPQEAKLIALEIVMNGDDKASNPIGHTGDMPTKAEVIDAIASKTACKTANMGYYMIDWAWQDQLDREAGGGKFSHDLTKTRTMPLLQRLAEQVMADHGVPGTAELIRSAPGISESEAQYADGKATLFIGEDMRNKWTLLHEMAHVINIHADDASTFYDAHGSAFRSTFTDLLSRYGGVTVDLNSRPQRTVRGSKTASEVPLPPGYTMEVREEVKENPVLGDQYLDVTILVHYQGRPVAGLGVSLAKRLGKERVIPEGEQEFHVNAIQVYDEHQRQGIATAMYAELHRRYPGVRVLHSPGQAQSGNAHALNDTLKQRFPGLHVGKRGSVHTAAYASARSHPRWRDLPDGYIARGVWVDGVPFDLARKIVAGTATGAEVVALLTRRPHHYWGDNLEWSAARAADHAEMEGQGNFLNPPMARPGLWRMDMPEYGYDDETIGYGVCVVMVGKTPADWPALNTDSDRMVYGDRPEGSTIELTDLFIKYDVNGDWEILPMSPGLTVTSATARTAGPADDFIPARMRGPVRVSPGEMPMARPVVIDRPAEKDMADLPPAMRQRLVDAVRDIEDGSAPLEAKERELAGLYTMRLSEKWRAAFYMGREGFWHLMYVGPHDYGEVTQRWTRTSAASGPMPDDIEFRHVTYPPGQGMGPSAEQAIHAFIADGRVKVGDLYWNSDPASPWHAEVTWVEVNPFNRRQGIATEMLRRAREVEPQVHHSDALSRDGEAWTQVAASKTAGSNGDLPPRLRFTYDDFGGGAGRIIAWDDDATHPRDREVGIGMLSWDAKGVISWVQTYDDEYRRRGIATAMLAEARKHNRRVRHSDELSQDAKAWSQVAASKTHTITTGDYEGISFEYDRVYRGKRNGQEYLLTRDSNSVTARTREGRQAGYLTVVVSTNEIGAVSVIPAHQRQGLATAMLEMIREQFPGLAHTTVPGQLSPAGEAWSQVVGSKTSALDLDLRPQGDPMGRRVVWEARVAKPISDGAGTLAGYLVFDPSGSRVRIIALEVNPAYARQGVGTWLLNQFLGSFDRDEVDPGQFTPAGAALWKKVTGEDVQPSTSMDRPNTRDWRYAIYSGGTSHPSQSSATLRNM